MTCFRITLILIVQATFVGCHTTGKTAVVHHVDPVLSNTLSCEELVDYLNSQNEGLHGWRCMTTRAEVKTPDLPFKQVLNGELVCSAPSNFRLTAENFAGMADFGSNDELCWAYVKPGEPAVMTWRHEDSHLLEYVPGNFPRLDPEWLMVILGIQPLNAEEFHIQKPPAGSRDLWLASIEESASGQPLRRVIKVDTVRGFAYEHALIDHNGDYLLRAQLSNYRTCGGHVIPHTVRISFAPQETELTLNFKGIEANCQVAEALWTPPGGDHRIAQVDLGDYVRRTHGDLPRKENVRGQALANVSRDATMLDGTPRSNPGAIKEPDFDEPESFDESLFSDARSPDGRFFGNEQHEPKQGFEEPLNDDVNGFRPGAGAPIIEAGHLIEPDFDTVAPKKSGVRWFGK